MTEPTAAHAAVLAATCSCPIIIRRVARAAYAPIGQRERYLHDAAELARELLVKIEIAELAAKREAEAAAPQKAKADA
jgi:hypothetical protein